MLSILIPTYNYSIVELVRNVHKQAIIAKIPFEIIVIDDCSTNQDIINKNDTIEDAILMVNGQDRFIKRKGKYFRLLVPYQRHTRTPDKYIYVYSFALNPEQIQPSGSCNFSRLDNSELLINMTSNTQDSQLRVYATNYNILKIINGMGGLAYSN